MAIEQQLDEFEGEAHGTGVSFIQVDLPPGGPTFITKWLS